MALGNDPTVTIPEGLLEAIRTFPPEREVEHCGTRLVVGPFDLYAQCPHCGVRLKVRAFSGVTEIEDIFDAVFEWMRDPKARAAAEQRRQGLAEEDDG
jgi:hypothetical protein